MGAGPQLRARLLRGRSWVEAAAPVVKAEWLEMRALGTRLAAWIALGGALAGCPGGGGPDAGDQDGGESDDGGAYCPAGSPMVHFESEAVSDNGKVTARLVDTKPAPPQRYYNDWTVDFLDADGKPLDDMQITKVRSYMPVHQHGVVSQKIVKLSEPGRFEVQDIDLFMRGPWEVQFSLTSASTGDSYLVFNHCLDY
jgi:hypothetical protein